jgi:methylmalonyl-CoA mutase
MTKAVAEGLPKHRIEEAAAARAAKVDTGETVIVGVNRYQPADEEEHDILEVDNAKVRAQQIARIDKVRAGRDEGKVRDALEKLTEAAKSPPLDGEGPGWGDAGRGARPRQTPPPNLPHQGGGDNLLALSVDAARARATLGEISDALERAFGRYGTTPDPVRGIYGNARHDARWKEAVRGTKSVAERLGRKPRILVAKMGQDGHDRGANLVSSAFTDLGFDVIPGPLFQTPRETAQMAVEKYVDVIGASSLAAGHRTLIPEMIEALKEMGRADIKVVAGGVIPPQDYAALRAAGVQAIFGPGTNLADAADKVLRLLGHNRPPLDEAAE